MPSPRGPLGRAPVTAIVTTSLLVVGLAGIIYVTVAGQAHGGWAPLSGMLAAWAVFVAAALAARRLPARHAGTFVLLGSLLLGGVATSAPPVISSDSARYAWDGMVQKAGISPYAYVPADQALESLRPGWLFHEPAPGENCYTHPFPTGTVITTNSPDGSPLCTAINRPHVPTVYPAVAELYFLAVRLAPGPEVGFIAFQLAGLAISLGVTAMLLRFLRRAGRPAHQAVWWAWCPLVAFEAVNGAHVDVLGAALAAASALLLAGGRPLRSGVAFGAAVAAKLIPVITAPGLLYRKPGRFVLAAAGTFAAAYAPYVLAGGPAVLGYLPGYLREEGYVGGGTTSRFALLQVALPAPWDVVAGILLLAGLALHVWRHTGPANPWDGQVLMTGATLLVASPAYEWYALLLLPFVVLSRRYEYLLIPPVLTVMYLTGGQPYATWLDRLLLAAAALLIAAAAVWRRRRARTDVAGPPLAI